jgi:hypothetical protein
MDSRILFFVWVIRVRGIKCQDATPKSAKSATKIRAKIRSLKKGLEKFMDGLEEGMLTK